MNIYKAFVLLLVVLCCSCVERLVDDDTYYTLTNGGKHLEIYVPEGVGLSEQAKDVNLERIEEIVISGSISGANLSLLRDLSGGNDKDFLGGRNLNTINIFYRSLEIYNTRENEKLTVHYGSDIPSYAFENCYVLQKLILPDMIGIYSISEGAFLNCLLLKDIEWGKHVRKIGYQAFRNCSSLGHNKKLALPEGVKTVEGEAFADVHPVDVVLPSTIQTIGSNAFSSVIGDVYIYALNPPSMELDSFLFHKKSNRVLYVPSSALKKYQIEPFISMFASIKPIADD